MASVLCICASGGGGDYTEMLELILSAGAEVNAVNEKNTTALHLAARFNSRKIVALLLAAGADVHSNGETALSEAVEHHGAESVRLLLAAGADPNQSRPNGHSLLHIASQYADVEVAAALIAGGADVSARNRWGHTPPEPVPGCLNCCSAPRCRRHPAGRIHIHI